MREMESFAEVDAQAGGQASRECLTFKLGAEESASTT